jgi:rod shape-determining protein MreD
MKGYNALKKYGFIFLLCILLTAFQQAIISQIVIFNSSFDMVFVFIICFSLTRDDVECVITALILGIIKDCYFPQIFGINTVIYVSSAYILSQLQKRIYKDAVIIPVMLSFIFTLFKNVLYFGYLYIASIKLDFVQDVANVMLIEALYNSIISLFIYRFVKRLNTMNIMKQEWKF